MGEENEKKKKTNCKKPSLSEACSGILFFQSVILPPSWQVPQGEEYSPGGCSVHSPSPSDLLLNYLFLVHVPDTMLPRETKSIQPSHSDLLEEWKMEKEKENEN